MYLKITSNNEEVCGCFDNSVVRIGSDIAKEHVPDLWLSGLCPSDKAVKEATVKVGAAKEQDSKGMEEN
jgi:hypothetical protein